MNHSNVAGIEDLLGEADELMPGLDRLALCERAAEQADVVNDLQNGNRARKMAYRAAIDSGRPETALIHFSWRLGQFDKNPELFSHEEFKLLWDYKWIVVCLTDFPEFSRGTIFEVLDDFCLRLQRSGRGQRTEFYCRMRVALGVCDLRAAQHYFEEWLKRSRDELSDCRACEYARHASFLLSVGKEREAIAVAEPVLNGLLSCGRPSYALFASMLCPLVEADRQAEAQGHHLRTFPQIEGRLDQICEVSLHLKYLTMQKDFSKASAVFESHFPLAWECSNPDTRFWFYRSARRFLAAIKLHSPHASFQLPPNFLIRAGLRDVDSCGILEWMNKECSALATRFDLRNGNDYYTNSLHIEAGSGAPTARF